MRVGVAQCSVVDGDITTNICEHLRFAEQGVRLGIEVLQFPELSLCGYDGERIANSPELELDGEDQRLLLLRAFTLQHPITLIVGAALKSSSGKPHIGSLIIGQGKVSVYRKRHLHEGEERWFSCAEEPYVLSQNAGTIGLGICADMQQADFARDYGEQGCAAYLFGALITEGGYAADASLLETYARDDQLLVGLSNYHGTTGGWSTCGRSAIWLPGGDLLVVADDSSDVILVADKQASGWIGELHQF